MGRGRSGGGEGMERGDWGGRGKRLKDMLLKRGGTN